MPRRKLTPEERETFRAKLLETKRLRGVTELKAEGTALVAHLENAGRADAQAVAQILHYSIHRLGRTEGEALEHADLVMVGELLGAIYGKNRRLAVDALHALASVLREREQHERATPPRPPNVIDLFERLRARREEG
jgi:hypothetical protein